jgi:putative PIN family toxin of toxin-antitoxin system
MIRAIVDTNVLIRAALASLRSAAAQVLDAYYDGRYLLVFSPATVNELLEVLILPHIRARHGWSDDEILQFITTLLAGAVICPGRRILPASLTRDITDMKFLSLAEESSADFLVTNDRRHLLRLRQHGRTRILTPAKFLKELDQASSS